MNVLKNEEYIKELDDLKHKMVAAEDFAGKFPCFKNEIIDRKISGEGFNKFDGRYESIYLAWGICRGYYETAEKLTNYKNKSEPINRYLFNVYVNTLTLYDLHENFGLFEIAERCKVFYIDHSNSTFYIEDGNIVNFLDTLNEWHINAKVNATAFKNKIKKEELLAELQKIEEIK